MYWNCEETGYVVKNWPIKYNQKDYSYKFFEFKNENNNKILNLSAGIRDIDQLKTICSIKDENNK